MDPRGLFVVIVGPGVPDVRIGRVIGIATSFSMMLSALVLMIWKPRWLKPQWLLWLEDNYPYLIDTLLEEARKEGKAWEAKVRTQENLEEWAKQTAGRYGA